MKNNIITISIAVILSVTLSAFVFRDGSRLGSAIIETETTDTIETFRTNVNTSLTSLQAFASSTSLVGVIASTSPLGTIAVGSGTATSSISGGNFCQYFKDEAGRGMWIKLATSGSTVFSTSTVSCQ